MKFRTFWGGYVLIVILWITTINDVCGIEAPFISAWTPMASDGTSPVVIQHTLGELPAKVDVQVKVTYNGIDYMFPGMGSAPRDDDLAADYGGVGYLYNEFDVKVYVPVATNSGNGPGWAITTGGALYTGPFVGSFTSCDVRVRAWKQSYWPTPSFVGSTSISTSSPYVDVSHGLGVYPDFVTVQLTLSTGYVSEAQGTTTTTADHSAKWINSCGTIFGVTDSSVTLWAAAGADDFVACFKDGWGSEDISYSSASVVIRAWVLTPSEVIQNDVYPYTQSVTSLQTQPQLTSLFDSDFHIVIVETKDNSIASGRAFYGAGSASQGELNEAFGGTVYGYSQSHVALWTSNVSYGKPIYVDGIWGGGSNPIQTSDVFITIRVIATGTLIIPVVTCPSPPSIADGYYDLSNDTVQYYCNEGFSANQTKRIFNCNNTIWEDITVSCEVMMCQAPNTISNAVYISNGYQNGSQTLYSCMAGYAGNIGNRIITCNGTHWSNTNLTCSENLLSNSCGLPPNIIDAFVEITNDTVNYYCRDGYIANQSMNTAHCINGQWTQLSLGCINATCDNPPIIPNTLKLSNGLNNGSMTLYTCTSGFASNGENPTIFCNGTHWSISQYYCSADSGCGLPPNVLNAYYVVDNNTATYQCLPGYTQTMQNNFVYCNGSGWNTPSIQCSEGACGDAPEIPNAINVSDGYSNGSVTLYSCLTGFLANSESPIISCNGSDWSSSTFQCLGNLNCGLPPKLPNGYYVIDNNTATYYCLPGFTANGQNNTAHCNESTWNSPSLTCAAQFCPTPLDIANTDKISSGFSNGSLTVYTCVSGFVSNGEDPFIFCNGTHWSNTLFSCSVPSVCGSPPTIQNTTYIMENQTTAVYTCLSGYIANESNNTSYCVDNVWSKITLTCVDQLCPSPPDNTNTVKVSSGFSNGSLTVYTCKPGFFANYEVPYISCNGTHWTNTLFECSGGFCPSPSDIANTVKMSNGSNIGSLTVYTCVSGFVDNGENPFISCNGTHWTNTLFACSVSNDCGPPPSLPNASYILENQTTAVYSCLPGFIPNNQNNAIYCKDFVWSNISLTCTSQLCTSPPEVPNTVKTIGGFSNGSLTVYTCVSGFVANEEVPYISCNGTHWTNTLFACSVSSDCGPPPSLPDASYILENQTTVVYNCLPGYTSNKSKNTIYCINSTWSNISFTCTSQLCTSPPEVPNTVKTIGGVSNGSLTVYTCVSGFVANEEVPYISCNGTNWTNTLFACSVSSDCGHPPSLPDASYILENQTTAVYNCLPGYTSNNLNNAIYCKDSVWSNISLTCTANSCPSPPDLANSLKVPGGYTNGSLTIYTCVSGFASNGEDPYIICNGTQWTNTLFACSDSFCQEPPSIHNASVLIEGFQTGNLALYSCAEGYVATGGLSTITCNGTHWSQTNFSCLEGSLQSSFCGPPPTLSNAYYEIANNTATYLCQKGYTANQTDNVISCLQEQWEEPSLSCLDISCPTPPDIANALKISDGLHNGSVTMYACLPDYVASNVANTILCNETSWMLTNFSCSLVSALAGCVLPPSIPHGYYMVQNDIATYYCLSGYTANTTSNTIHCIGAGWEQLSLRCIAVGNFTSTAMIDGKFAKLRIPKNNTNAYERSLNCADDPRPSARAIGGVGAAILCLVAGLVFLSDCISFFKKTRYKSSQKAPSSTLDSSKTSTGHVYVEETLEFDT